MLEFKVTFAVNMIQQDFVKGDNIYVYSSSYQLSIAMDFYET